MPDWTWEKIERIIRKSIRLNGHLSYDDEDLLEQAYTRDPHRYVELHKRLRLEGKAEVGGGK